MIFSPSLTVIPLLSQWELQDRVAYRLASVIDFTRDPFPSTQGTQWSSIVRPRILRAVALR